MLSATDMGLELIEFMPGRKASVKTLKALLPDVETALFFAKALDMTYNQLRKLLEVVFDTTVLRALTQGSHSTELQDYLVDSIIPEVEEMHAVQVSFDTVPHAEFLPAFWEAVDVQIATSLKEVASSLADVVGSMPGLEGSMTFQHMAKMNRQRPTIGTYQAAVTHQRVTDNLVVLDVSGSMTESTISTIIADVVALSWKANAHLAIVSNTTRLWQPGTYTVDDVLREAEFGGTRYETLAPLFERNWGTVVAIADYDSAHDVRYKIAACSGRIGRLLDLSLVNKPTFLSECLGQIANEVQPLMLGNSHRVLR